MQQGDLDVFAPGPHLLDLLVDDVARRTSAMSSSMQFPWTETDAMFLLLVKRADALQLRGEASEEEELDSLLNAMDAYEAKRWPEDALRTMS